MWALSNLLRTSNQPDSTTPAVELRLVRRGEIDDALRLVLAGPNGLASDEQVLDFLSHAVARGADINALWVARDQRTLHWALLPVASPGRTMLLVSPTRLLPGTPVESVARLITAVCADYALRGTKLVQALLDPDEHSVREIYKSCGFVELAELLYLHRAVGDSVVEPDLPAGFSVETYSAANHAEFSAVILASYRGSLDCPGLNGVRDVEDILDGHKSTGIFDPRLWFLLREQGVARGALLLNRTAHDESLELVYLGLSPETRGRGAGDALMKLAIAGVRRTGRSLLSLAVDAKNQPALRLYFRHGMKRMGNRLALLRDLSAKLHPAEGASAGLSTNLSTVR
ncbi:MAG: GNAT family N-acetyltransferase [Tepidisphaeraceae bacterium]